MTPGAQQLAVAACENAPHGYLQPDEVRRSNSACLTKYAKSTCQYDNAPCRAFNRCWGELTRRRSYPKRDHKNLQLGTTALWIFSAVLLSYQHQVCNVVLQPSLAKYAGGAPRPASSADVYFAHMNYVSHVPVCIFCTANKKEARIFWPKNF